MATGTVRYALRDLLLIRLRVFAPTRNTCASCAWNILARSSGRPPAQGCRWEVRLRALVGSDPSDQRSARSVISTTRGTSRMMNISTRNGKHQEPHIHNYSHNNTRSHTITHKHTHPQSHTIIPHKSRINPTQPLHTHDHTQSHTITNTHTHTHSHTLALTHTQTLRNRKKQMPDAFTAASMRSQLCNHHDATKKQLPQHNP